jgi:hypothetical protein
MRGMAVGLKIFLFGLQFLILRIKNSCFEGIVIEMPNSCQDTLGNVRLTALEII